MEPGELEILANGLARQINETLEDHRRTGFLLVLTSIDDDGKLLPVHVRSRLFTDNMDHARLNAFKILGRAIDALNTSPRALQGPE